MSLIKTYPLQTRATVQIHDNTTSVEGASVSSDELARVKEHISHVATLSATTLLVSVELRGNGWTILWWPASEPRHSTRDEIIYPEAAAWRAKTSK